MNVFITGINGFIGSSLARYLLNKNCQICGSVRKTSDLSFLTGLDVKCFTGHILDEQFLTDCFQNQDIIFHVAALASDWGSWEKFYAINVDGTKNVARAALKAKVTRLVFISSTAVYGFAGYQDANESFQKPVNNFTYAKSKIVAENWLFKFHEKTGLPITIIQPANVFGPYDRTFFIKFADALEKIKRSIQRTVRTFAGMGHCG